MLVLVVEVWGASMMILQYLDAQGSRFEGQVLGMVSAEWLSDWEEAWTVILHNSQNRQFGRHSMLPEESC